MSTGNNWHHSSKHSGPGSHSEYQEAEKKASTSTGGLLSKYKSQQGELSGDIAEYATHGVPSPYPVVEQPETGSWHNSLWRGPLSLPSSSGHPLHASHLGTTSNLNSHASTDELQLPTERHGLIRHYGVLASTMQLMQRWSGNLAAVAGHKVLPPAPYMELYHAPVSTVAQPRRAPLWKRSIPLRVAWQKRHRRVRAVRRPKTIVMALLLIMLLCVLFTTFAGTSYVYGYYCQQLPRMNELASAHVSQNTRIYDRNGVLLYDVYDQSDTGGRRIPVTYKDIPHVMQDAMVAIEDKTFWTNPGIEPMAIIRAAARQYGGGSTLTQQVIKNLSGDDQYSLNRKIAEAAMAIGLTRQYSKAKIMEMYFNAAPFGSFDNGIEAAVEKYFHLERDCSSHFKCIPGVAKLNYNQSSGKNDPLLGLARASLLAGMPNQPALNDPTLSVAAKQRAILRQGIVLQQMMAMHMVVAGLGPITPALARKAQRVMRRTLFIPYRRTHRAPHFVDWVISQVSSALGNGDGAQGYETFQKAGLNIRTTIDVNLEEYVERAVDRHLNQPEYQKIGGYWATLSVDKNLHTAAVVVLDAKTGEVLAMDGSGNYNANDPRVGGQFNAAINARPPGSTFKPIEYATAFQMGWYPGIVLQDNRTYFPHGMPVGTQVPLVQEHVDQNKTGIYAPYDYGHTYTNRAVTLRTGMANSYNIPALKAMLFAGPATVLATARRLGIVTQRNDGISWGLGSRDVPLLQMAGAYQTFANDGARIPPQSILDIWDNYGHNLYHYNAIRPPASQVFSPQVSYMTTSILSDEPSRRAEFGNDHDLSFADIDPNCAYSRTNCARQVAAKTGTTDDFRDNWTIGYTPDVVVGVWVGNANNEKMNDVIGITGAGPIWHSVMERVLGQCNYNAATINQFVVPDQVPCGPDYHFRFSQSPQWTFANPGGLVATETSPATGLPALGASEPDWVWSDEGSS